jgi:PAS domain S-box-containing protein
METHMNPLRNHSTLYHPNERELKTQIQPDDNEAPLVRREAERQQDANKGSWQWDLRTDITTWSEQLHRIAGRDPMTIVPSFKEHSSFYTSDSWDQLITATLHLLRTGEPYELELQVLRPDGTRRWVICSGEAARDTSGYILRLFGTVEDLAERVPDWGGPHAAHGQMR